MMASGALSILIGTALVGTAIYEKLNNNKNNERNTLNKTNAPNNASECISDDKQNFELVMNVKREGYQIFINTVEEYIKNTETNKQSFEYFMKEKWPSDYIIYMDNKNNVETTCLRTYKHWENMYNAIKINKSYTLEHIMNIGEQGTQKEI